MRNQSSVTENAKTFQMCIRAELVRINGAVLYQETRYDAFIESLILK